MTIEAGAADTASVAGADVMVLDLAVVVKLMTGGVETVLLVRAALVKLMMGGCPGNAETTGTPELVT